VALATVVTNSSDVVEDNFEDCINPTTMPSTQVYGDAGFIGASRIQNGQCYIGYRESALCITPPSRISL
jgi:hypothetical protein